MTSYFSDFPLSCLIKAWYFPLINEKYLSETKSLNIIQHKTEINGVQKKSNMIQITKNDENW